MPCSPASCGLWIILWTYRLRVVYINLLSLLLSPSLYLSLQYIYWSTHRSVFFLQTNPTFSSIAIPAFFPLCCSLKILISWSLSCCSSERQGPSSWWKYLRSLWVYSYAWVWLLFSLTSWHFARCALLPFHEGHASLSAFAASTSSFLSPPWAWITVVSELGRLIARFCTAILTHVGLNRCCVRFRILYSQQALNVSVCWSAVSLLFPVGVAYHLLILSLLLLFSTNQRASICMCVRLCLISHP